MKTGALIRAAVRMGAILGGADNDALGHLTAYAEAAGRAFQLADDLLDVTASPKPWARPPARMQAAGKQTLVATHRRRGRPPPPRRHRPRRHHRTHPVRAEADTLREAARYVATRKTSFEP